MSACLIRNREVRKGCSSPLSMMDGDLHAGIQSLATVQRIGRSRRYVSIVSLLLIYFIPSPPSKVTMATAFKGSSFEYYGHQYREIFARFNVDLELRPTSGAVENIKILQ